MLSRLHRLSRPVDGASLAIFRIAFGLLIALQVARYFWHDWIAQYYIRPRFHFTYLGFSWVRPWAGMGMYAHFGLLGFVALLVAVGALYRITSILLWVGITYVFLLEEAQYGLGLYAASLFALLLAVVPAHRVYSMHGLGSGRRKTPAVPLWSVWLLRAQTGVIYVLGGVGKIGAGWIHGEPMRTWLIQRGAESPVLERIVADPLRLSVLSYGGNVFELVVVPALLWRRTRPLAFVAVILFEAATSKIFSLGLFPWIMILASTLFFDPDWPRKIRWAIERINGGKPSQRARVDEGWPGRSPVPTLQPALAAALALYLVVQLVVPLRRLAYPRDVAWTDEGHRFSWRVRLNERTGSARFVVTNVETSQISFVDPHAILDDWQAAAMATSPDMVLQFAHFIAKQRGGVHNPVEVRAEVLVSLGRRERRELVDHTVNLVHQSDGFWPAPWIVRGPDVPVRSPGR